MQQDWDRQTLSVLLRWHQQNRVDLLACKRVPLPNLQEIDPSLDRRSPNDMVLRNCP